MYFTDNKYHGPQKWEVSLYFSLEIFKPCTWEPHSLKVSKWAGKAQDQMFAHQQQDSTDSYKYLVCASSFEANEALVCWGATVSLTHTEHRRISLQDEQRVTGFGFPPFFFLQLFLLQNKKNLLVALQLMLDVQMCTRIITIGIQCSSADWISLSKWN